MIKNNSSLADRFNAYIIGELNVNVNDSPSDIEEKQRALMELSADIVSGRADELIKVQTVILPELRKYSRQNNVNSDLFF